MKEVYGIDINYMKVWHANECAIKMLRGGTDDGYMQMLRYIYMLNNVYPNSHIRMNKSVDNDFLYLFIALHPMIRNFEFCISVVVADNAH